jgi:hypothetical protein
MGIKASLQSPPPYMGPPAYYSAVNETTPNVIAAEKTPIVADKIKYAIFYRYLTGLRRTFSGPAIFDTYEECKAYCDDLNALNAQKYTEDIVLFHFPG